MENNICKMMSDIQNKLKATKDMHNNFGGYYYRSAESILAAVKPLLAENGAYINLQDDVVLIGERYYIKATATIVFGDKTQISSVGWAREAPSKKGMDESQITGATSSYARKYALNGLFGIDDVKDADTNEYQRQTGAKPKEAAKPKTQQPDYIKVLGEEFKKAGFNGDDMKQAIDCYYSIPWKMLDAGQANELLEKVVREPEKVREDIAKYKAKVFGSDRA